MQDLGLAGEVDDLVKKLKEGKLSPQDVLEEMKRRKLLHHQNEKQFGKKRS